MNRVEIAAEAELKELGDIPVDDVLGMLDRKPPGYRDLYYRWERQQWEAGAIDFSEDRRQWSELPVDLKRSLSWAVASVGAGHEPLTDALVPLVDAAPSEEHHLFLATQLVDEARHTVFFDLFIERVLDHKTNGMKDRLVRQRKLLNRDAQTFWFELLPAAASKVRAAGDSLEAVVQGVVFNHIAAEATLELTAQRFLLNFLRDKELLPGFRQGSTAIARDGARHVQFGALFLKEAVESDHRFESVVRSRLDDVIPPALSSLEPPEKDPAYLASLSYTTEDLKSFAQASLADRLKTIGL